MIPNDPNIQPVPPTPEPAVGSGARLFCAMSLAFLLLAALMLAGRPGFLFSTVLTGHGLAWLEILVYGSIFPGVFGVAYWALPRAFGVPLFSEKFVFLHFVFHLAGTVLTIVGLFFDGLRQAAMGTTFIACGALVFAINAGLALRAFRRPDVSGAFLATTILWLVVAAFLGSPFASEAPLAILPPTGWSGGWLVLALAGVGINGALGLSLRVGPCALGIPLVRSDASWYALAFTNGGLAWLFAALAFGPMPFVIFCASIYAIGVLVFLAEFLAILQRRASHLLVWDAKMVLCSVMMLPVATGLVMLAAWERMQIPPPDPAAAETVAEVPSGGLPFAFLPVDAATVLTVLLAVCVPALVGLIFQVVRLEKGLPADAESTGFHAKLSGQILLAAFFNYATGVLMIVPAAWAGIERIVTLGVLFLLVGAIGFLGNFFFVMTAPEPEPGIADPEPVR